MTMSDPFGHRQLEWTTMGLEQSVFIENVGSWGRKKSVETVNGRNGY
jgi:hypothetical protein